MAISVKIGLTAKGAYDGTATYAIRDMVEDSGNTWLSLGNNNVGNALPTVVDKSNDNWELMAKAGDTGAAITSHTGTATAVQFINADGASVGLPIDLKGNTGTSITSHTGTATAVQFTDENGDNVGAPINLKGATGLSVTSHTGSATAVQFTDTDGNNVGSPINLKGETGATPNITIGTVTKASEGGTPSVSLATGSTTAAPILDMTLVTGDTGLSGATIHTGTTAPANSLGSINDIYIKTDSDDLYIKTGATTWSSPTNFTGSTPSITIGTVTKVAAGGTPSVSLASNSTTVAPVLDITLVTGDTGLTGTTPVISIGTVTKIAAGGTADVRLAASSTDAAPVFDIDLVIGDTGTSGATIHTGTTTPANSLGAEDDIYIKTDTSQLYIKTGATTWGSPSSIAGSTPSISIGTVTKIAAGGTPAVRLATGSTDLAPILDIDLVTGSTGSIGNVGLSDLTDVDTVGTPTDGDILAWSTDAFTVTTPDAATTITDNLTSTATDEALSANQGKVIDAKIPTGTKPATWGVLALDTEVTSAVSAEATARGTAITAAVPTGTKPTTWGELATDTEVTSAVSAEATARGTAISAAIPTGTKPTTWGELATDTEVATAVSTEATARDTAITTALPTGAKPTTWAELATDTEVATAVSTEATARDTAITTALPTGTKPTTWGELASDTEVATAVSTEATARDTAITTALPTGTKPATWGELTTDTELSTGLNTKQNTLPDQTGNANKVLSTNGTALSWVTQSGGGGVGEFEVDVTSVTTDAHVEITIDTNGATTTDFQFSAGAFNITKWQGATITGDDSTIIQLNHRTAAVTSIGMTNVTGNASQKYRNVELLTSGSDAENATALAAFITTGNTTTQFNTTTEGDAVWNINATVKAANVISVTSPDGDLSMVADFTNSGTNPMLVSRVNIAASTVDTAVSKTGLTFNIGSMIYYDSNAYIWLNAAALVTTAINADIPGVNSGWKQIT